jgi:protein-L-isoaspartate(D-aspartate) O-methyltransferase
MTVIDIERARYNMAEQQIRPWEVFDERVLAVMQEVPRERFVPHDYRELAFADLRIPLGHGEVMMEPKVEARMLQALEIEPTDHILEVGTGSGFVTACLATLGNSVVSYDIHEEFIDAASDKLARQGIHNVRLHLGNPLTLEGLPKEGFDVVAVTGSMPLYDPALEAVLADGGRLFQVVGQSPVMHAMRVTRRGDEFVQDYLFETDLPPLKHIPEPRHFRF